jgi:hypothetical protein
MLGLSVGKMVARGSGAWWPPQAVYAADFMTGRYMIGGVEVPASAAFTFARASTKLAPDRSGIYHAFAVDELARTDRGAWLEPASTNYIRNNTNLGAVAGTATLPTNWSILTSAGLNREVVALGSTGSLTYMDLRLYGTANTAGPVQVTCEAASTIAANPGETWTISAFLQAIAQPAPPTSTRLRLREDNSAGGTVSIRDTNAILGPDVERYSGSFVLNGATTVSIRPVLAFGVVIGGVYDFTLRVGLVAVERQAAPTTPIETSGTAGTASQDELTFAIPTTPHRLTYVYEGGVTVMADSVTTLDSAPTQPNRPLLSLSAASVT